MCKVTLAAPPRINEVRRANSLRFRQGVLRVEKHLPPANISSLGGILGHWGEVPSDGDSLLLAAARNGGVGSQGQRVALVSPDGIRLSRSPHMKYEHLSVGPAMTMGRA